MNDMPSQADLRRIFEVDAQRGLLFWKKAPMFKAQLLGCESGCLKTKQSGYQYVAVKVNQRIYKRGRIIFMMVHGFDPNPLLDHIDGNSLNDAIYNLRPATHQQNAHNQGAKPRKVDLPAGVDAYKDQFRSRIFHNKKVMVIGYFNTANEAHIAYLKKARELRGDYTRW